MKASIIWDEAGYAWPVGTTGGHRIMGVFRNVIGTGDHGAIRVKARLGQSPRTTVMATVLDSYTGLSIASNPCDLYGRILHNNVTVPIDWRGNTPIASVSSREFV